ncbi:glycoside hydrolase family 127 protein [Mongoliitalea daihaiensis]|uniref:glycoside hydrolase family 127 protein n=1 Tax=Mongoliitalea daihaiensis TaxID=2782006 RepID=UPI001F485E42|nr:glycoside hydrolase family 127 protein [Mongoliitalea daihaiensis]UJP65091.1 glycoside hydrolase family 127 protein [Mongoliitalea daihaiensis]
MSYKACLHIIGFFFIHVLSLQAQTSGVDFFRLDQVTLLESPFSQAMKTNQEYILEMDVDRLLAPFMKEAGLSWPVANYGNWESGGLDGHTGGHYLSALAMTFASTGDPAIEKRLDYMLEQLQIAQEANGSGYLSGVPGGKIIWEELRKGQIKAGSFSLNDRWVPLYNIHKIFAGLRDAYLIAGKEQAKPMLMGLTDWFLELTATYTEKEFQEILISEHGGLNEIFADMYELTSDPRYLTLARQMSHQTLLAPLTEGEDRLTGMHANTQIPKVIGFQRIAALSGDDELSQAAQFFWDIVVNQRSVSIGGNSVREHFHPAKDFSSMISSEEGPETCNSYNMLRLSEKLFQKSPQASYFDYYERTLFNHILSSQHPENGGFVYFTSMRPNHYRVYSQPHENFWCCVGSGLENHAKYGHAIYATSEDNLFINLFIASELDWEDMGIKLIQQTKFPFQEGTAISFAHEGAVKATLRLRYPSWVAPGKLKVFVNKEAIELLRDSNGYVMIQGVWSKNDHIEIELPMEVRKEQLPDGSPWVSFLYGPVVLGAKTSQEGLQGLIADGSRMGHVAAGPMTPLELTPVLKRELETLPTKVSDGLTFELKAEELLATTSSIELVPFFSIHDSRYQVYWPEIDSQKYQEFRLGLQSKDQLIRKLEAITVDKISLGEQQPESEHAFKGEQTATGQQDGSFWRSTQSFISYQLKNTNLEGKVLRIMLFKPENDEAYKLFLNGVWVDMKPRQLVAGQMVVHEFDFEESMGEMLDINIQSVDGKVTPKFHHIRLMK